MTVGYYNCVNDIKSTFYIDDGIYGQLNQEYCLMCYMYIEYCRAPLVRHELNLASCNTLIVSFVHWLGNWLVDLCTNIIIQCASIVYICTDIIIQCASIVYVLILSYNVLVLFMYWILVDMMHAGAIKIMFDVSLVRHNNVHTYIWSRTALWNL